MDDCIFCKIINKKIPAAVVYEDDRVIAFNDLYPVAPVHVLIVPKQHISNIMGINAENAGVLSDIHLAAQKVAQKLGISEKGFRLINNCGEDGGQTVLHLHYHLLGGVKLGAKIL